MKKILAVGMVALFMAPNAFANVKITETDNISGANDASMQFQLDVSSTFVYKLKNKKADTDAATAGQQEGLDSLIDLGLVTAGIPLAANSGLCSDLVGLTAVADLAVDGVADSDTGLTAVADSASCAVHKSGSNVDLRMVVPMAAMLSKSGAGGLDIAYSRRAAGTFQTFEICSGLATAAAPDLSGASAPGCVAVEAGMSNAQHGYQESMHVILEARLAGTGALASYTDYVDVNLTEHP